MVDERQATMTMSNRNRRRARSHRAQGCLSVPRGAALFHPIMAESHESGQAFFDGFFASALQRANLTSGELQGRSDGERAVASGQDEYAPDGNGLDCGTDPGPVDAVSPTALANGVSGLQLAQSNARAAASALLTRSTSASGSRHPDLDLLAQTRGGGLGTPTGERTAIGTAWNQSGSQTPVMDKDGLGWPAKATLDRLHHTPAQADANEKRLAQAITTVLECIGEDPTRAGLLRTPERYAKALLWMTRGYEVRLSGKCVRIYR